MPTDDKSGGGTSVFTRHIGQNTVVYAQRTGSNGEERHTGMLIGNIGEESLIIGEFGDIQFEAGEQIILRMVLGNFLIGFQTEVVKKIEHPPLYITKFPIKVESVNLRKSERIHAFFPAEVHHAMGGGNKEDMRLMKTRIIDISSGGCNFRSKMKMETNSEVQISFMLPGDRQVQYIDGIVLDSVLMGTAFDNRIKFKHDGQNLPIIQEIARWVDEGLSYAADGG